VAELTPHFVRTADGYRVTVHDLGGSGEPIVLAHALGLHGRVWEPVAHALRARFRCLSLDLRGHGDSDPLSAREFSWREFGRDVTAVVDQAGLGRPWGLGHSAGATALLLAEEERPETFRALYLYEPLLVPADPPLGADKDSWLAAGARQRRAVFPSRAEALRLYSSKPPLMSCDPAVLIAYVEHGLEEAEGGVTLKCRPEDEALFYETATAHDCFGRLSLVECPVLVCGGAESDAFDRRVLEEVLERLPAGRSEVLPGLDHLGPLTRPAQVAASFTRFTGTVRSRPTTAPGAGSPAA
jgi:pimeloyl-ACP methyl ester carboxylesterase